MSSLSHVAAALAPLCALSLDELMYGCKQRNTTPPCGLGHRKVAPEIDGVEAVEHRLQLLRREEMLQLVRGDDLLQLRPQALLDVGAVAAAGGCLLRVNCLSASVHVTH